MHQRRWIDLLSDYKCEIKYQPGKENVVADALSRKERLKPRRVPPWCRFVVGVSDEDDGSGVRGSGVEQEVGKRGYGGWRENRLGVKSAFKKRGEDGTIL
nr:reverse transcriptase domain-containing protein [Tanacetum cinerariifolium]